MPTRSKNVSIKVKEERRLPRSVRMSITGIVCAAAERVCINLFIFFAHRSVYAKANASGQ